MKSLINNLAIVLLVLPLFLGSCDKDLDSLAGTTWKTSLDGSLITLQFTETNFVMTYNFEDEFEAETGTYYFYGTTVTLIMEDYDDVLTGTVNGKKMTFRDGSTVIVFTRS